MATPYDFLESSLAGLMSPTDIQELLREARSIYDAPSPADQCGGAVQAAHLPAATVPSDYSADACAPQIPQVADLLAARVRAIGDITSRVSAPSAADLSVVKQTCADGLLADLQQTVLKPLQDESAWVASAAPTGGEDFCRFLYSFIGLRLLLRQAAQMKAVSGGHSSPVVDGVYAVRTAITVVISNPLLTDLVITDPLRQWLVAYGDQLPTEVTQAISGIRDGLSSPMVASSNLLGGLVNAEPIQAYELISLTGQAGGAPTWPKLSVVNGKPIPAGGLLGEYFVGGSKPPQTGEDLKLYGGNQRNKEASALNLLRSKLDPYLDRVAGLLGPISVSAAKTPAAVTGFTLALEQELDRFKTYALKVLRLRMNVCQDPALLVAKIGKQAASLKLCGATPGVGLLEPIAIDSDGAGSYNSTPENTKEDDEWRDFEGDNAPNPCEIRYWRKYAQPLNVVGLLPTHWSIGLILPSPAGPIRVPLPVVWIPILVLPAPSMLTVIWLTINGVVVCPTVWQLRMLPMADSDSYHLTLFRGANTLIKSGTGVKVLNPPVVNLIDINPAVTKVLPYEKDDIPVIQRVTLTNPLLLNYLRKWCSSAKPYMGFP